MWATIKEPHCGSYDLAVRSCIGGDKLSLSISHTGCRSLELIFQPSDRVARENFEESTWCSRKTVETITTALFVNDELITENNYFRIIAEHRQANALSRSALEERSRGTLSSRRKPMKGTDKRPSDKALILLVLLLKTFEFEVQASSRSLNFVRKLLRHRPPPWVERFAGEQN